MITASCYVGERWEPPLYWVESAGYLLKSNKRIQVSDIKLDYSLIKYYRTVQFNATLDMEAFGCRMSTYESNTTLKWFNFTVGYPPISTLISNVTSSGNNSCSNTVFEFFCDVTARYPEKVGIKYQL